MQQNNTAVLKIFSNVNKIFITIQYWIMIMIIYLFNYQIVFSLKIIKYIGNH